MIGGHPLPGQQQDPVMFVGAASETGLPEQPACPVKGAVGGAYDDGQIATHFLQTMHRTGDGDNFSKLVDAAGNTQTEITHSI